MLTKMKFTQKLLSFTLASLAYPTFTMQSVYAAGEAMARDYIAGSNGLNLAIMYYVHKESDTFISDGKKLNADFKSDLVVARYVHFMELGGMIIDPQIILPFGNIDINIPGSVDHKKSGTGDAILLSSFWFVNNPEKKIYAAFTPYLTLPTGTYNANSPTTSLGSNRWSYTAEFGMSKGFGEKTFIDLIAAMDFYGKNDDYLGKSQKKDPLITLQAIYSYNLSPSVVSSTKYSYMTGGKTELDSLEQNDKIQVHTMTIGLSKQLNKSNNIQVEYNHDIKVNNTFENNGVRLRYVYAF